MRCVDAYDEGGMKDAVEALPIGIGADVDLGPSDGGTSS